MFTIQSTGSPGAHEAPNGIKRNFQMGNNVCSSFYNELSVKSIVQVILIPPALSALYQSSHVQLGGFYPLTHYVAPL